MLTDEQIDAVIEAAENRVGMGHGAWDMVNPREIVRAIIASLTPSVQEGKDGVMASREAQLLHAAHDQLHRLVATFVPGNDGAYTETTDLMRRIREAMPGVAFDGGTAGVEACGEPDDGGPLREGWQVSIGPGHAGFGCYAHMTEYPDEGAVCLATFDPKEYPDAAAGVGGNDGR